MNTHPSRQLLNKSHDSFDYPFVESCPVDHPNVDKAIELLEDIDIDGETMEYIITRLFMREQMLKQLMNTCQWFDVCNYYEERQELIREQHRAQLKEEEERLKKFYGKSW